MKSKASCLAILLAVTVAHVRAQERPPGATNTLLSLDTVICEVLSNNPSLKSARASWEAMKERIPQARAWEDPKLGFDTAVARFVELAPNSMPDQRLMVEQTLPLSGKNRLRGQAAGAEAVGAFEEFRRRELDVFAAARAAYFQYANALVQLELNRRSAAVLKQLADQSRSKYEAGTRPQSDVLSAETELAKLEEAAFDIQRQLSDAQSKLNTLMNRPALAPLGRPVAQLFQPSGWSPEKIEALTEANRPELRVAESKVAAAQARLAAAHKEWIPEPGFRVEGDRYNASGQVISEIGIGFSINLPWFNRSKYKAGVRENEKLVEVAQHDLDAARLETLGRIRDQLKKTETFHHHTELFRTKLLPLAEQTVTSKRLSYETDRAGFLELLSAQRDAQEVEAMYWDHLMHYQEAVVELEALVGTNLNSAATSTIPHQHEIK